MEWITKIISKQDYDTSKEALNKALELIDRWCKEKGFTYQICHNDETGINRVLYINTQYKQYKYKLIISTFNKGTGEHIEERNIFFDYMYLKEVTKPAFFAHLDRLTY